MADNNDNSPCIGRIYPMRQSVHNAFGIQPNASNNSTISSESNSSNSSVVGITTTTSFSRRKSPHPHLRPCLLWNWTAEKYTVLLLTTFNGDDPMKADGNGKSIIPYLTPDQLAKRLVMIAPTKPLIGRPSISFDLLPAIGDRVVLQENHYLILIPICITKRIKWQEPSNATFSCIDLLTINKLIADLQNEQLHEEENEFYKEKLNFYEHAATSHKPIEELHKKKEEFSRRCEALEAKKEKFKRETEEQNKVIRRYCQQRFDEGAHNQMNDRESESSIPIRLCRCSSPLLQGRVTQYTSDRDSDSSIHDDDEPTNLSRASVYQWLNTHPDVYQSFDNFQPNHQFFDNESHEDIVVEPLMSPSAEEMTVFNQKEYDIIASGHQNFVRIEGMDPMTLFMQDAKESLQTIIS